MWDREHKQKLQFALWDRILPDISEICQKTFAVTYQQKYVIKMLLFLPTQCFNIL